MTLWCVVVVVEYGWRAMTCDCIVGVQWPRWARPDLGVLLLAGELTCAVMRCSVYVLWVEGL